MAASRVSRTSPLNTRRVIHAGQENWRSDKQLEKELTMLEKERRRKLRELEQSSRQFINAHVSPTRSLSPDSRTPPSPRSPSPSMLTRSPRSRTPTSPSPRSAQSPNSPNRGPLLTKRQGVKPKSTEITPHVTKTTVFPIDFHTSSARKPVPTYSKQKLASKSTIPQIVINDDASSGSKPVPVKDTPKPVGTPQKAQKQPSKSTPRSKTGASLSIPVNRSRSNSVPSLPPFVEHLRSIARPESTFEEEENPSELDLAMESPPRQRSNTIASTTGGRRPSSQRRDSIINKYTARRGSFRRTSVALHEIIADLKRSIPNLKLLEGDPRHPPITEDEWEALKNCRYLRNPSQEGDTNGNTLDIDEIFSHK